MWIWSHLNHGTGRECLGQKCREEVWGWSLDTSTLGSQKERPAKMTRSGQERWTAGFCGKEAFQGRGVVDLSNAANRWNMMRIRHLARGHCCSPWQEELPSSGGLQACLGRLGDLGVEERDEFATAFVSQFFDLFNFSDFHHHSSATH